MSKTDRQIGYTDGRLGNESRYPNNRNYMQGYESGDAALRRELAAWEPFEDEPAPQGCSDANFDQFYC